MADPITAVCDSLEHMLRHRHGEAHNGDIYRGGDYETCPLCAETREIIRQARATSAALRAEGEGDR